MSKKNIIAVMYSGGTDSTYAAWSQMKQYKEIRLISFIRPGFYKLENPDPMVNRLKKAFPDNIIKYEKIDYSDIYDKITPHEKKMEVCQSVLTNKISPLWIDKAARFSDNREAYDIKKIDLFMTNECLQCKIGMHLAAIKYCRQNNITDLCDGGNSEQVDDGSQLEDVKELAVKIFKSAGINYFSPAFKITAADRCKALFDSGVIDNIDHKKLEKEHKIPSTQLQCTVPMSVLWTVCVFPWMVYDAHSLDEYVDMCYNYYQHEMQKWIQTLKL